MLRKTFLPTLALGLYLVAPGQAHAQDCVLDTDCAGGQICLDQLCADPQDPLDACQDDADCHVGDCVDGFCKETAVQCASDDGSHCRVAESSFECLCAGGEGFGGAGGFPGGDEPQPEPDPDAMYSECLENLAMCEDIGGDGDGDGDGDEPVEPEPDDDDGDAQPGGDGGDTGEADDSENAADLGDDTVIERGCSVGGTPATPTGFALAALALLGLRRRRMW